MLALLPAPTFVNMLLNEMPLTLPMGVEFIDPVVDPCPMICCNDLYMHAQRFAAGGFDCFSCRMFFEFCVWQ
jgi:hypothetical protein